MGALLGDEVVHAEPGDLVFKPRDQWHTFWNAGDTECRILEIISPAGFEKFFDALADMNEAGPPDPEKLVELAARYGLEFDLESDPGDRRGARAHSPMLAGARTRGRQGSSGGRTDRPASCFSPA